jgi:myo-inositol-1(or 4)-monophosphatase
MRAAARAGEILLDHWERPVSGRAFKTTATDEVSDADRAAEAAVIDVIRAAHPNDTIRAEEGGSATGTSGRTWLIDPLDGTVNWLYRIPQWSVSIACLEGTEPVIAVVHDPAKQEMFFGQRGAGAWLAQAPAGHTPDPSRASSLAVTTVADPALALLVSGFAYDAEERREQARREGHQIAKVRDVRRLGSAALDLAYVSCGRVDGYYESYGEPWDWAAGRLLVLEAGGRVSDVAGVRAGVPGILASGPNVHNALLDLVRGNIPASGASRP